ncbi:MAG: hypothetical protein IKA89_02790, partial [Anaerotignum sp.]|nr:hypothetical protein [Anaerotignum sp.]
MIAGNHIFLSSAKAYAFANQVEEVTPSWEFEGNALKILEKQLAGAISFRQFFFLKELEVF